MASEHSYVLPGDYGFTPGRCEYTIPRTAFSAGDDNRGARLGALSGYLDLLEAGISAQYMAWRSLIFAVSVDLAFPYWYRVAISDTSLRPFLL